MAERKTGQGSKKGGNPVVPPAMIEIGLMKLT